MADDVVAARRTQRRTDACLARALAQALRPHGMNPATYETLAELGQADGRRLRMQGLAAELGLTSSGLTRVIDRAVHEGWVTRELPEGDQRGRVVTLTEAGAEVLARAYPAYVGALRSVAS